MIFTDAKKRQEKVPFAFSGEFPVFKDVEVTVQPVEVKVLTIGGTEFVFSFSLRNPNDFELVLGSLDYRLDLDGKTAAQGAIEGENKLDAGGEKAFTLPVMLDFFEVGKEFYAIFDKPAAACRLGLRPPPTRSGARSSSPTPRPSRPSSRPRTDAVGRDLHPNKKPLPLEGEDGVRSVGRAPGGVGSEPVIDADRDLVASQVELVEIREACHSRARR